MITCPSCQQPVEVLEQHKGTLYTCPHCNAVYFIDWNGQPEVAEHETPAPPESEVPSFAPSDTQYTETPAEHGYVSAGDGFGEMPNIPYGEQSAETYSEPNAVEDFSAVTPAAETYAEQAAESFGEHPAGFEEAALESPVEEAPYDFNSTLDAPAPMPEIATPDTSDFSDVTDFANAEVALGAFSYTVVIEGLESSQLVHQFKEHITDLRFRWDVNGIIKSIRGGRVVITGLGPAKTSVLVNRIKYMPVKISWRQDVLSSN